MEFATERAEEGREDTWTVKDMEAASHVHGTETAAPSTSVRETERGSSVVGTMAVPDSARIPRETDPVVELMQKGEAVAA